MISQQAEWKPLITHPEQGAEPAGLPGPFQHTLASESVLWVLTVQLPISWPELKDEQLAQGSTASAKGGPVPAPAVLPVLLILQNGDQHGTKHLRRDELHSWEALLLECIAEVLACKSPSMMRQEQTYLIRTLCFPSTSRLPLTPWIQQEESVTEHFTTTTKGSVQEMDKGSGRLFSSFTPKTGLPRPE